MPRKFSEKIAIQRQKAAEQEEAFASIMREVASARHPVGLLLFLALPSLIIQSFACRIFLAYQAK